MRTRIRTGIARVHSGSSDVLWDKGYFGANIHPYETIFIKTMREIDPVLIDNLSKWHLEGAQRSWDMCT